MYTNIDTELSDYNVNTKHFFISLSYDTNIYNMLFRSIFINLEKENPKKLNLAKRMIDKTILTLFL